MQHSIRRTHSTPLTRAISEAGIIIIIITTAINIILAEHFHQATTIKKPNPYCRSRT
jgi:hypothetical protein